MANQEIIPTQEEEILAQQMIDEEEMAQRVPAQTPVIQQTQLTPAQAQGIETLTVLPQDEMATAQDPTGAARLGDKPMDMAMNAYRDIGAGLQQENEATAEAQEREAQANLLAVQAKGQINQDYQNKLAEINEQKTKATDDYFSLVSRAPKEINPNRWWHNLSTGQKIQAGIAQLMAGLGGARVDPIGDAIKRDIQAQKDSYKRGQLKGKGIFNYFKEKGKSDKEAAGLAYAASLKQVEETLKAQLMKQKPGQTRSRIGKALGKNKLDQAKNLQKLQKEAMDYGMKQKKAEKEGRLQLSGEQQKALSNIKTSIKAVIRMKSILADGGYTFNPRIVGSTAYTSAQNTFVESFGRYKTGANMPEDEVKGFKRLNPTAGDIPSVVKSKLINMIKDLRERHDLILSTSKGGTGQQPRAFGQTKYKFKKTNKKR